MKVFFRSWRRCSPAVLLLVTGLLSACGQYGDLYLPEKHPAQQQPDAADGQQDKQPEESPD